MRKIGNLCCFILFSFMINSCHENDDGPGVQIKKLNYPSASAIEYYNGKLYVMGDDATSMIVLDTNLKIIDSIPFTHYSGRRIPKDIKSDLEASSMYLHGRYEILLLFGSMSAPNRNHCYWYDFKKKAIDRASVAPVCSKIKRLGIEQVNVEGICTVNDDLIISNRGNKSYKKNFLLVSRKDLWKTDTSYEVKAITVMSNEDTAVFAGISGLHYSEKEDLLIMSVSTEDTRSVYEDGAIGKSYLWIIDSISHKLNRLEMKPDRMIDLEKIDPDFKGQKIESATVIEETKKSSRLILVADNDDGTSTIFKLSIKLD